MSTIFRFGMKTFFFITLLICTVTAYANKSSSCLEQDANRICDISFTATPTFAQMCVGNFQTGVYTVRNNTPVPLTITFIRIQSNDSQPASASTIDPAVANSCVAGASLASGATCNVKVNLQPVSAGVLNRTLQIGVNTHQSHLDAHIVVVVASCGATPVPIPPAANFCVIVGSSTVTNTGATIISGDVCLSPGSSITGFPPGIATSLQINTAEASSAKAADQALFTALNGLPCTVNAPANIGGLTLTPGVYCFSSSATITGTLTLSGAGNYVFIIPSTFDAANNSTVLLTNGADNHNIYWNVGSSATLGTNSVVQGRIIASTSVTLNTGAALLGSAAALTGAVTLDDNAVTPPV